MECKINYNGNKRRIIIVYNNNNNSVSVSRDRKKQWRY